MEGQWFREPKKVAWDDVELVGVRVAELHWVRPKLLLHRLVPRRYSLERRNRHLRVQSEKIACRVVQRLLQGHEV